MPCNQSPWWISDMYGSHLIICTCKSGRSSINTLSTGLTYKQQWSHIVCLPGYFWWLLPLSGRLTLLSYKLLPISRTHWASYTMLSTISNPVCFTRPYTQVKANINMLPWGVKVHRIPCLLIWVFYRASSWRSFTLTGCFQWMLLMKCCFHHSWGGGIL